jgi:phosphonate transport system substrate-binding protein
VPIVVRKDIPAELAAAVKKALLALDPTDPRQRERMKEWDPEFRHGFAEATEADYQPIFQLMDGVQGGCGIRCH